MSGETDLKKLIASMEPSLDNECYIFATLEKWDYALLAQLMPVSTFQEKEGLTVVLTKDKANEYDIAYSSVFKCITLAVHSSLEAVGLTAAIATKLTEVHVSANVIAAYYHDHVFVGEQHADKALAALLSLVQEGR
ncbi:MULTISPECIES: ACT domain-containing protein [Pseudoalteromonas]|uniref:DUF2241 domain-containing protein n=1 Tax=Pseudoalteromonas aurantia 208 TaxID=1314867 RepID=A0ABR9EHS4_9GAMM|nr:MULTISPECIES: ACT domain-containing protein [Pseudoalteromonas]MBE0370544.1 hypothetical protein [Pseudoalteromonas aurantia 208]MBQ4845145.1 ACT domain-containing protein [Pseudoalteromonas sp. MMG005]